MLDSDNIQKYLTNLSKLAQTCDRWSLDFNILRDQLIVVGVAPEYIQEFIRNNQYVIFNFRAGSWEKYDDILISARFNKDLEFFIALEGKKENVEKFISDRIKISKGYRLEFIGMLKIGNNLRPNQYEYKIVES